MTDTTTTSTLYSLTGDAARLARQIEEAAAGLYSEDPEQADAAVAALNALVEAQGQTQSQLLAKANSWAWVIHSAVARGEARAAQAKRLQELARRDATQAERMKAALVAALQRAIPDKTSYQLADHRLASRASEVVEITVDPTDLPEIYRRLPPPEADKVAIKNALKCGHTVYGAQLVQRRSWKLA